MPNLHFFIVSRIDKNLGLYGEQEIEVKADILKLLKEEVSVAKGISNDLQDLNPKSFNPDKKYEVLQSYYKQIGSKVNIILAKQIAKFDDKQIKKFFKISRKRNDEIEENIKDRETEDYYDRYEFFLDDLNQKQKDLIAKNIGLFKKLSKQRLENRLSTQAEMKVLFKIKDINERQTKILELFSKRMSLPMTKERKQAISLFGDIIKSMDSEQIKYFREKQQSWLEWLDYYIQYFSSK